MKKQENEIFDTDQEMRIFSDIVNLLKKREIKAASKIYMDNNLKVVDLIHINNDAEEGYLSYFDKDQNKYDIVPYLDNHYLFTLMIEQTI